MNSYEHKESKQDAMKWNNDKDEWLEPIGLKLFIKYL